MHPEICDLVACVDGEGSGRMSRQVAQHVARCPVCREEIVRLHEEKQLFAGLAPEACQADETVLDGLLAEIRQRGTDAGAHRELRQRALEQLRTYFGSVAAGLVNEIEQCGLHGRGLQAATEPLFTAFLGRKAAAGVMSRIRRGLETESPS